MQRNCMKYFIPVVVLLSLSFLSSIVTAQGLGSRLSEPLLWPAKVGIDEIDFKVVKDDERAQKFVYQSKHFELNTPFKLEPREVKQVMRVFEATHTAVRAMPFDFERRMPRDFTVRLYSNHTAYVEAGGYRFDNARYIADEKVLFLSPQILDLKKSSAGHYNLGRIKTSEIIGEVTEQLLAGYEFPYWLKQGIARYMELVPYHDGYFQFDQLDVTAELKRKAKLLKEHGIMSEDGIAKSKVKDTGPAMKPAGKLTNTGFVWVAYIFQLSDPEVGERFKKFIHRTPGSWERGANSYRILTDHSTDVGMDIRIDEALRAIGIEVFFYED